MGEICPQTRLAKLIFKPPSYNDNIKANLPPANLGKKSPPIDSLIPSEYLLDFFLRYKHHFK